MSVLFHQSSLRKFLGKFPVGKKYYILVNCQLRSSGNDNNKACAEYESSTTLFYFIDIMICKYTMLLVPTILQKQCKKNWINKNVLYKISLFIHCNL